MSDLPGSPQEILPHTELGGAGHHEAPSTSFGGATAGETSMTVSAEPAVTDCGSGTGDTVEAFSGAFDDGQARETPGLGVPFAGKAALRGETSDDGSGAPPEHPRVQDLPVPHGGSAEVTDRPRAGSDSPGDKPPTDKPPAGSREAGGEGDEPLLPTTATDMKWETLFGGQVLVATDPRRPGTEVVKIYRDARAAQTSGHLLLPSNAHVRVCGSDIVQVHTRNAEGMLGDMPSKIFQVDAGAPPWAVLPKGYYVEFDPDPEFDGLREAVRQLGAEEAARPQTPPISGRNNQTHLGLDLLSAFSMPLHNAERLLIAHPGENAAVQYVHYQLFGKRINVILPGGSLMQGQTHDIVEKIIQDPLGTAFEPLWRQRLGALAKQEEFITL